MPHLSSRWIVLIVLTLIVIALWHSGLLAELNLEGLKSRQDALQAWTAANPWLAAGGFFAVYVLVTAIADSADHGLVKVLTQPGKDPILGAAIVAAHAGDLLAEFVLAMKHGLGLNKLLGTIHIYPTMSEANKYVAGNWKRAHAPQSLLRLAERFLSWRRG
ncbi:MAG: hypothetical protein KY442_04510 [Proteobacteria bacterium]|nr:hypothetical protein [Pseudomonadota bacterium]